MKLTARQPMTIAARRLKPGDAFEVNNDVGRLLVKIGRADEAAAPPPPPPRQEQADKRRYKRRDMTAEDTQEVAAPDHRDADHFTTAKD